MNDIKIVAHPDTKKVFTETKNEKTVIIQIATSVVEVSTSGFMNLRKRVAFVPLEKAVAELPMFKSLKDGSDFPLPGRIVVEEFFEEDPRYREGMVPKGKPVYELDEEGKRVPALDEEGNQITEVILVDGKEVYRNTFLGTEDQADELIIMDSVVEGQPMDMDLTKEVG